VEAQGPVGGNRSKEKCAEQHELEKGPQNGRERGNITRP
jgi:hypothetical protein